jgi:hypothetical protein
MHPDIRKNIGKNLATFSRYKKYVDFWQYFPGGRSALYIP